MVDLVDVGLLGRKRDIVLDLVADRTEQGVVEKLVDNTVLIGSRFGVFVGVGFQNVFRKEPVSKSFLDFLRANSCREKVRPWLEEGCAKRAIEGGRTCFDFLGRLLGRLGAGCLSLHGDYLVTFRVEDTCC